MSASILKGILIPIHIPTGNGRIYPKEVFNKAIEEYIHKMLLEERIKKLILINEKIKGNNRIRQID